MTRHDSALLSQSPNNLDIQTFIEVQKVISKNDIRIDTQNEMKTSILLESFGDDYFVTMINKHEKSKAAAASRQNNIKAIDDTFMISMLQENNTSISIAEKEDLKNG